ncbi:unnamed protein product [Rotaria socialis]
MPRLANQWNSNDQQKFKKESIKCLITTSKTFRYFMSNNNWPRETNIFSFLSSSLLLYTRILNSTTKKEWRLHHLLALI